MTPRLKRAVLVPVIVLVLLSLLTGFLNFFGVPPPISTLPTREKVVALTFDDGPSAYTVPILETLRKERIKATFFVLGEQARQNPSIIRQEIREGHEVENHSWSHPHIVLHRLSFARAELVKTSALVEKLTGRTPRFFRPPYGQYHLGILRIAEDLRLSPVLWSVTGYDWLLPGATRIQSNVLEGLKPGAIILLHDGGGNREQTAQALAGIIEQARSRGFRFVLIRGEKSGSVPNQ